jgi:hypothetical protein
VAGPWHYWTNSTVTSTATWTNWTTTTATTAGNDTTWVLWTDATSSATTTMTWSGWINSDNVYKPIERTPEQRAEDERRWTTERAENARRAAVAAEDRRKACETARRLLVSMLSHQQHEQLQRERFFEVIGRNTKRRYRIREGTHGNVRLLDEAGREVTSYCGQPNGVPTEDSMLAQKLQIEHDEDAFLRVANARRLTA